MQERRAARPAARTKSRKPAKEVSALRAGAGEVARLLKILSHPNRLLIACELMCGEASVSEIEERAGVRQPVLSRDLARLRAAGLVVARRDSKLVYYRLADDRLANVIEGLCVSCALARPAARRSASGGARAGAKGAGTRRLNGASR